MRKSAAHAATLVGGLALVLSLTVGIPAASAAPAGPGKPAVPDVKPPLAPTETVRPEAAPATVDAEVTSVTTVGEITSVKVYQAAPGVTAKQLHSRLQKAGVAGLRDPAAPQVKSINTCTWGNATTAECPQIHWARNGFGHPQIYFTDHTSSAWPVTAAVPVWNEAQGVDSWYRWATCPSTSGILCVHVYNDSFGANGWVGETDYSYNTSSRNFVDGSVWVWFNDSYSTSAARKRKTACHELGHALGMGHNSSTGSCLVSGDYTPSRPNANDFSLIRDIYASF
jgi:hypothetical protein